MRIRDAGRIDANIGTGITDTKIADLLVIISPDGKIDREIEFPVRGTWLLVSDTPAG